MIKNQFPSYQPEHLAQRFHEWMTKIGPFKRYRIGPNEKFDVYSLKTACLIDYKERGLQQIIDFCSKDLNKSPYSFTVHNKDMSLERARLLRETLGKRMSGVSGRTLKKFYDIFDEPEVIDYGEVRFDNKNLIGIQLRADIHTLHFGEKGKLSSDLFVYGYNMLVKPSKAVLAGIKDDVETDQWVYDNRTVKELE